MAEDEDDDGFGDFTFASFNPSYISHQQSHHQSNGFKSPIITATIKDDDDDEWGDFIETPLGSFTSSNNTPSKSSSVADPFHFLSHNQNPTSQLQNSESGNSTPAQLGPTWEEKHQNPKNQNGWVKLKGAIPLSIFGDVEEEEEVARSGASDPHHINGTDFNFNKKIDNGGDRSKSNGYLGASFSFDAITSLYNQQISSNNNDNNKNGVGVHMNGFNLGANGVDLSKKASILDMNGLNLKAVLMHKRSDSDGVMNLSSQSLKRKGEDGVNPSTNGMNSNLDALNLDFSGWNADFNGFNAKSSLNFDIMKTVNGHSFESRDEITNSQFNSNGTAFGVNDTRISYFDGFNSISNVTESKLRSYSSKTNGVDTALNFIGRNEELAGSEGEDDEWEFKDAHAPSQVSHGNEKVRCEVGKTLENNTTSELGNGTNKGTNLFTPNGSTDLFSMSNGFPSQTDWFDIGVDNRSSNAGNTHVAPVTYLSGNQTGSQAMLDPHLVTEIPESDEDFGEFAAAFVGTEEKPEAGSKVHKSSEKNASLLGFDCSNGSIDFSAFNRSVDLFVPSNGKFGESNEVSIRFGTNPVATANAEVAASSYTFDMPLRSEHTAGDGLQDPHFVIQSVESDENFGEFREAFVENALGKPGESKTTDLSKSELESPTRNGIVQEKKTRLDQYKGALPLSIFGDEEQEVDGSLSADDFMLQLTSSKGNGHCLNAAISMNDLISNLYSQAEQISSSNSLSNQVVNGFHPSESVSASNLVNDADGDDISSWEFKDSCTNGGAEIQKPFHENENAHERSSVRLKLQNYVDFYSKLKDQLYFIANVHLESLKETQSTDVSREDENLVTPVTEIQEACKELGPQNVITKVDNLGDHVQREINLSDFVEALQEPKFHILQTEYDLERKLLLVEKDVRSVIELTEHAKTMLKIFMLGSLEEQSIYVSVWSKMISTCAQELQHGALLWRQSLEKNIHTQILAEPQGKTFVLALGEIYRIAVLLEATVKLYKPWILSTPVESSRLSSLLEECHSSWSSSGLEEALSSIFDATPSEGYLGLPLLMDSIKYICDLDELALQNQVLIQQEPVCRLSLLPPVVAPGMSMVDWDGEHCFLRLANLWANLVSTDHPKLPCIHVNG